MQWVRCAREARMSECRVAQGPAHGRGLAHIEVGPIRKVEVVGRDEYASLRPHRFDEGIEQVSRTEVITLPLRVPGHPGEIGHQHHRVAPGDPHGCGPRTVIGHPFLYSWCNATS